MAEEKLHPLEIQHNLLSQSERDRLMTTITNASVEGHAGFTRVLLTIMGFTAGGRLTDSQASNLTKQAELLFTNLAVINMTKARDASQDEDPLVATLRAAQKGASKVRPSLMMDDDGPNKFGLQVLNEKGEPVDLK